MNVLPVNRGITHEIEGRQELGDLDPSYKIPIAVLPINNEHDNVGAAAEYLSTPAAEISGGDLLYPTIDNDRDLYLQAVAMREQLNHELEQQAAVLDEIPEGFGLRWSIVRSALHEAEQGNWARLEHCGLKVNPSWLNDITRSMLRNRPVEVEVAQTHRPHVDRAPGGHYAIVYDDILKGQSAGIAFAAMLRRIQEGFDYTRPVFMVDDMLFSTEHFAVNALHRNNTLLAAYRFLQEDGAIDASDQPGRDFIFVPQTRETVRVGEMIERLQQTETGMLIPDSNGQLYFRPGDRVYSSVTRQYSTASDALSQAGVLLQTEDGTPTDAACNAASYLHPINAQFTHVRLHGTRLWDQIGRKTELPEEHQAISILLQSLGIAYPDRDHTIYYDNIRMSPERTVFALTTLLRNEIDRVIVSLGELKDVKKAMIPEDYFHHNYNSEVGTWPEDIQGVRVIGSELPLHYEPGEIKSAAIIGYGPFSYPGLALAPFMQNGAMINISDLLPDNIAFAQKWFSGDGDPQQEAVYRRFGDLFRQGGKSGRFYQDCEQQLRAAGQLSVAALEKLPSDSAQVIVESFVSCSNNIEKFGFYKSIRQKARVLTWTPRSMMIAVHMVGSGGWNNSGDDEGIKIPAANLSLGDIEDGYTSAGLRIVKSIPLHSDTAFREDYKGMVAIFAKPDAIDRLHPEG